MGRQDPPSLSLHSDDEEPARGDHRKGLTLLAASAFALLVILGLLGYTLLRKAEQIEREVASLAAETREATTRSREAMERAVQAEASARAAAEARQMAESQTLAAQEQAEAARTDARSARDDAARAQAAADQIRKRAEAELNRLEGALGEIAETQRTALGLVMRLGSDYLKFEFDKAELRELLSRVAGILLTSQDYTVSVNGHTDDRGSEEYNQKLSERRAQAVRDYLVKSGLSPEILSVTGHGKSLPLVRDSSDEARAKNRRVELGIASTRIRYGRPPAELRREPPPR